MKPESDQLQQAADLCFFELLYTPILVWRAKALNRTTGEWPDMAIADTSDECLRDLILAMSDSERRVQFGYEDAP